MASAGTHALVGEPIDHSIALRLRRRGVAADSFRARRLRAHHVVTVNLVLPMTAWHRDLILTELPWVRSKTFTLLELARIVGSPQFPELPAGTERKRLRALVRLAARRRDLGGSGADHDVPDPYMQGPEVSEHSFQLMVAAVEIILRVLRS